MTATEATITPNAMVILKKRYLIIDPVTGHQETPEDMFHRVAKAIAEAEIPKDQKLWDRKFFRILSSLQFLPNSPTLFNAGTGQGSLSACFVLIPNDTMESIFQVRTDSGMIQKYGGGVGYSFGRLRSEGTHISSTHGSACGAVATLIDYSGLSHLITQGGKRHGANMGMLPVDHPEVENFIKMKADGRTAQNFNISVLVTDKFLQCVDNNLEFPLVNPKDGKVTKMVWAREIWDSIIQNAWATGDPGVGFIDRVNDNNPNPGLGPIEASNPCGEQYLENYGSCNLGSIDVSKFVAKDKSIHWSELGYVTQTAVRFLDNVVTVNEFDNPRVKEVNDATRRIGLGVMGFADLLVKMRIPYDSNLAIVTARDVMGFIQTTARATSVSLAEERGPFPLFDESIWKDGSPMRNSAVTTIAPTGTISAIAGCWFAIEPYFALELTKNVLDGEQLHEVNPYLEEVMTERGESMSDVDRIILGQTGSIQACDHISQEVKDLFKISNEIPIGRHLQMQAAFQDNVDNSVSKTINMSNDATIDDVRHAYEMARSLGLKGITIYRDGSKVTQVLDIGSTNGQASIVTPQPVVVKKRPNVTSGVTERVRTGHGTAYITINFHEGKMFEVFANVGKAGGHEAAMSEGISRMISTSLRSGITPENIVRQLRGITCCPAWDEGILVKSIPDAIAIAMERSIDVRVPEHEHIDRSKHVDPMELVKLQIIPTTDPCPECTAVLTVQAGCATCLSCGWSECG